MAFIGAISSNELASSWSNSARRKVLWQFPEGNTPIMALLGLFENGELLDKPEISWYEQSIDQPKTQTKAANAAGPFTNTSGTDLTSGGWTLAAGQNIRIYVDDASKFVPRDNVMIRAANAVGSTFVDIYARVTAIDTADGFLTVMLQDPGVTSALNTSANVDLWVFAIGNSTEEASRSGTGYSEIPFLVTNFTQIFTEDVGPFSRNAIHEGLKYEQDGEWKNTTRQAFFRHMVKQENAVMWGRKGVTTVTTADGLRTPARTMGGIKYFLEQYEKGSAGDFDYRANGPDITASSWLTEPDKRIIDIGATGSITSSQLDLLMERAFETNGNDGEKKVWIGGPGMLAALNSWAKKNSVVTRVLNSKEETFGMKITEYETVNGSLVFKVHPLFKIPSLRYDAFILDPGSIVYHPVTSLPETLHKKNVHANDFDGRKDQFLTEFTIEPQHIERNLYVKNLQRITV